MHLDDGRAGGAVSLFGAVARHVPFPAADEAHGVAAGADAVVDEPAVHAPDGQWGFTVRRHAQRASDIFGPAQEPRVRALALSPEEGP